MTVILGQWWWWWPMHKKHYAVSVFLTPTQFLELLAWLPAQWGDTSTGNGTNVKCYLSEFSHRVRNVNHLVNVLFVLKENKRVIIYIYLQKSKVIFLKSWDLYTYLSLDSSTMVSIYLSGMYTRKRNRYLILMIFCQHTSLLFSVLLPSSSYFFSSLPAPSYMLCPPLFPYVFSLLSQVSLRLYFICGLLPKISILPLPHSYFLSCLLLPHISFLTSFISYISSCLLILPIYSFCFLLLFHHIYFLASPSFIFLFLPPFPLSFF